jgi:recombination protein RecT
MSTELLKQSPAALVKANLDKNRAAIMASLPRGFNYDRMCRSLINAISTTPALAECTQASLFLSAVRGFSLGLEPNGPLAEGYLVPFRNKGVAEAQFMPSYRGLINLARRSGELATIYACDVCANDEFEAVNGTDRRLVHRPQWFAERGETIGYYAVYTLKDGSSDFEIMSMADIEKIRNASRAKNSGPWVDWFDEMAKKTVIKRLAKRMPMSVELASAMALDNAAVSGDAPPLVVDVDLDVTEPKSPIEGGKAGE